MKLLRDVGNAAIFFFSFFLVFDPNGHTSVHEEQKITTTDAAREAKRWVALGAYTHAGIASGLTASRSDLH